MNCRHCGFEQPHYALLCSNCGEKVQNEANSAEVDSYSQKSGFSFHWGGFIDAIFDGLTRWKDLHGRSTRAEYWWFTLFSWLVPLFSFILPPGERIAAYAYVFGLLLEIPHFAVGVRRLHDINRTGWWQAPWIPVIASATIVGVELSFGPPYPLGQWIAEFLISLFPLALTLFAVGALYFIILLYWHCKRSDEGSNRFGPRPFPKQRSHKISEMKQPVMEEELAVGIRLPENSPTQWDAAVTLVEHNTDDEDADKSEMLENAYQESLTDHDHDPDTSPLPSEQSSVTVESTEEPLEPRCLTCGHANPVSNKFCGECGEVLHILCPSCRTDNPPENQFCGQCGTNLKSA